MRSCLAISEHISMNRLSIFVKNKDLLPSPEDTTSQKDRHCPKKQIPHNRQHTCRAFTRVSGKTSAMDIKSPDLIKYQSADEQTQ